MGKRSGSCSDVRGVNNVYSNFLRDIKQYTDLSMEDLYEYIGKKMGLSSQTVRKYQSMIPPQRESELMSVVIGLAMEKNINHKMISQFYSDYSKEVKIAHSGIQPQLASEIELIHIEKYDWDHMICPDSVALKLEQFLHKSPKHFLYFCGTVKSGITGSVIKFMKWKMRGENGEVPKAFHIAQNSIEELRQDMQLKLALDTEKYVVLDTGFTPFPEEILEWDVNAKVIIVAHTPHHTKYLANMEYLVFNDLINTHVSVEQIVQSYAPELYTLMKCKEERLGEKLVQEMQRQTGGIPLAVRKICQTMYFDEIFKYEENLEEALSKEFCFIPALRDTYEELWEELMQATWQRIPEYIQEGLVAVSYFDGDISLELFHYLRMNHEKDSNTEEILKQCYESMLLMESGKSKNDENGSIQGIRMFPMMKALIRFKRWNHEEYHAVMKKAVEFYKMQARQWRAARFLHGHKMFFERGGEYQLITEILAYCNENNLNQDYLDITSELCGMFFLKESSLSKAADIYLTRLKVAERCNDSYEILETYGCLIGLNAKRAHKNEAVNQLKEAEHFLELHPDLKARRCHKYWHGKALKLLLGEKNTEEAMAIWEELLKEQNLTDSEYILYRHWNRECMIRNEKIPWSRLDDEFQQQFTEATCWAACFSCAIQIARVNIMIYINDMESETAIEAVQYYLQEAQKILEENPMIEDRYLSDYYMLRCFEAAIHGKEYNGLLKRSTEYYKKNDLFRKKSRMEKMAGLLIKNGNPERKNGILVEEDVQEMTKIMYAL